MAREYAHPVAFRRPPSLLELLLSTCLAHRHAPGLIVLRVLPSPRIETLLALADRSPLRARAGMNAHGAPFPSLIRRTRRSRQQRAWLNGFFSAYLGINGESAAAVRASEADETARRISPVTSVACHGERLALAKDRKPQRQLMAGNRPARLAAIALSFCQPMAERYGRAPSPTWPLLAGGKETSAMLKELLAALDRNAARRSKRRR